MKDYKKESKGHVLNLGKIHLIAIVNVGVTKDMTLLVFCIKTLHQIYTEPKSCSIKIHLNIS